jgi:hypothetical protein
MEYSMHRINGENYLFRDMGKYEEYVEKVADKVQNTHKFRSHFMDIHHRQRTVGIGFWEDVIEEAGLRVLFRGVDLSVRNNLQRSFDEEVRNRLNCRITRPPINLKGIVCTDLPINKPKIEEALVPRYKANRMVLQEDEIAMQEYRDKLEANLFAELTKPKKIKFDMEGIDAITKVVNDTLASAGLEPAKAWELPKDPTARAIAKTVHYAQMYGGTPESINRHVMSNFDFSELEAKFFNKPKQDNYDMKIEKPINIVRGMNRIDVLTASEEQLVMIIREAQEKVEVNKDLALISKAYAKKATELQAIIDLCVKQLDKIAK